ncbi:SprT family zinc-dependent metalloprotease [Bacteroides sp. 519]|uniref:YgjP family zinc-dependent metalloprotease n=1 Tax=Bacteroides sp. 519 TaxID=2302937 RepID=UPI0013D21106|nr:SprT family zinc-dependent metalloprotease [Bacteroides sp. 519]NDV58105.1 M48 family peptidase [Bacteroides sp. 519]
MKIIEDKELGRLVVRVNSRARRFIFHTKSDAIYVSVPSGTTRKDLDAAIESLRHKLLDSRERVKPARKINLDYKINAEHFKLTLVQGTQNKYLAHSALGEMKIVCPPNANFDNEEIQLWLQKVIEEGLRRNAKAILPPRLTMLSQKYNLPYKGVKINSSKGRWGSCSSQANINLTFYLLLLPQHLIDYVLLHELCHTLEMSHNDRFWAFMDKVTDNKALELRNELKQYKTEI